MVKSIGTVAAIVLGSVALGAAAACNVSATAPATTGGVGDDGGSTAEGGSSGEGGLSPDGGPSCDHGAVVLLTDYTSTQIALSALDGTTRSAAFLSTASTGATSVAFPLSGDVVVPSATPPSGRVVLLDRYGTNVVTWADPATAKVVAQLPVGTGFESNPQDYVETGATTAYLSRWGVNDAPGKQPFDSGSDVLVLDTSKPAITASIAMPVENGLPPRPARMLKIGDTVIVVLQFTSEDFATVGENALVGLQGGAIAWEIHATGLKGCDHLTLSPSGHTMAPACEGQLDANGNVTSLAQSALVLYDVTSLPPKLIHSFAISDQLGSPVQSGVTWASETMLLGKTQTPQAGATDNQAFTLDVTSGKATVILTAGKDAQGKGKGIVYTDVLCRPGCGDTCLLADGDVGKLRRWTIAGSTLTPASDVTVDPTTGLPPVALGGY